MPALRNIFVLQLLGSPWQRQSVLRAPAREEGERALLQRSPRNPYFNFIDVARRSEDTSISNAIGQLDILIQKFPKEQWLYAERFSLTLYDLGDGIRNGLFWYARSESTNPGAMINTVPDGDYPSKAEQAKLIKVIAVMRQGQRLDPQNAYYDFALFRLFVLLHRPREELKHLLLLQSRPYFHSYSHRRAHYLREVLKIRSMQLEEVVPFTLSNGYDDSFGEVQSGYRISRKELSKLAKDPKQKLEIYASLDHLQSLLQKEARTARESWAAFSISSWIKVLWITQVREEALPYTTNLAGFAQYARRYGRPDLAVKIPAHVNSAVSFRRAGIAAKAIAAQDAFDPLPVVVSAHAYLWGAWLVGYLVLALPLYIAVSAMRFRNRQRKAAGPEVVLNGHAVFHFAWRSLLFLALAVTIPLLIRGQVLQTTFEYFLDVILRSPRAATLSGRQFLVAYADELIRYAWTTFPSETMYPPFPNEGFTFFDGGRFTAVCAFFVVIALFWLDAVTRRQRRDKPPETASGWLYQCELKEAPLRAVCPKKPFPLAATLFHFHLAAVILAIWFGLAVVSIQAPDSTESWTTIREMNQNASFRIAHTLLLGISVISLSRLGVRFVSGLQLSPALPYGLRVMRHFLLRSIIVASVLYFSITLVSLPFRARVQQQAFEKLAVVDPGFTQRR